MKEEIIVAVQSRPALWDKRHKQHHNRHVLDKEWKAIATELKTTGNYFVCFEINIDIFSGIYHQNYISYYSKLIFSKTSKNIIPYYELYLKI